MSLPRPHVESSTAGHVPLTLPGASLRRRLAVLRASDLLKRFREATGAAAADLPWKPEWIRPLMSVLPDRLHGFSNCILVGVRGMAPAQKVRQPFLDGQLPTLHLDADGGFPTGPGAGGRFAGRTGR